MTNTQDSDLMKYTKSMTHKRWTPTHTHTPTKKYVFIAKILSEAEEYELSKVACFASQAIQMNQFERMWVPT